MMTALDHWMTGDIQSGNYTFVGEKLVTWRTKKQPYWQDEVQRQNLDLWLMEYVSLYGKKF